MARLDLCIEGIDAVLSVRRFEIRESVSELFTVSLIACSPRADLDWDETILRPVSFALNAGWTFVEQGGSRRYTGVCESIEQVQAEPSGLSTYAIRIVPRLWLLTERENCRIFQHRSIPDIITSLLDDFQIAHEWRVDRDAFPKLDYKVQFNESDYAFLSRLCEEGGLTFTFESSERSGSVLILSDAPCTTAPRAAPPLSFVDNPNQAAEKEFVTRVRVLRGARAGAVAISDYDFRNPALSLHGRASRTGDAESLLEKFRYEPGSFRHETERPTATPMADRAGVSRASPGYGQSRAERALQSSRADALGITFTTNALDLAPGAVFSIAGHPHPRLDESKKLLMTELSIEGDHDKEWTARGRAVLADTPYQPPRRTQKPSIHGTHTAIVTGPKDREIFSDEYGRVRIQFPWDREGRHDENSSCWVRAVQGWAGPAHGLWTVPRIGQEVLVSYLGGDPDEPIIVGRVANAHNPPPYPMPENETKTVLRSRSTPGPDGFSEISFEDRKGYELFYERAERDRESLTRNDERIQVGRNRAKIVKGDEDVAVLGSRRELVSGSSHRTVKGEDREHIKGSRSVIIDGDLHLRVSGRILMEAGGEIHVTSGTKVVVDSPDNTVNGGGGFVRATGGGVVINGPAVPIQQGGAPASGADSDPAVPELPTIAREKVDVSLPGLRSNLPMFPSGLPAVAKSFAPDYERDVICRAICGCESAHNGKQRVSQWCVSLALWEYDKALSYESTIKAEVPYDMSKTPPAPILSKKNPKRSTRSRPDDSEIPDVTIVYDGSKPPTQDNIKKVYEIKFGKDRLDAKKRKRYQRIAGDAEVEVLTPADCGCGNEEIDPLPNPISAKDAANLVALAILALATIAALLSPLVGDEVAAIAALGKLWPEVAPLLTRLAPLLAPLVGRLQPVSPPPTQTPR